MSLDSERRIRIFREVGLPQQENERGEIDLYPSQDRTLSNKQKEMIRRRDGFQCQFPLPHICNGDSQTLHVHHIKPFSYLTRVMGKPAEEADSPTNLISVCEEIHIGGRRNPLTKVLHPDTVEARRNYHDNPNSYKEMFARRERRLRSGRLYHQSRWDTRMEMEAFNLTNRAVREGAFSMEEFNAARTKPRGRRTKAA